MNIKVLTGFDGDCLARDLQVAHLDEYCMRHGYLLVTKFDNWPPSNRYAFWRKHELIHSELHDCDWLLWLDMDALIMNMTVRVEDIIDPQYFAMIPYLTGDQHVGSVYCAGVMLLRCCKETKTFLREWWEAYDKHPDVSDNDNTLLNRYLTPRSGVHPTEERLLHSQQHYYQPGDFIVHFCGMCEANKLGMFQKFLPRAIR